MNSIDEKTALIELTDAELYEVAGGNFVFTINNQESNQGVQVPAFRALSDDRGLQFPKKPLSRFAVRRPWHRFEGRDGPQGCRESRIKAGLPVEGRTQQSGRGSSP